MKLIDLDADKGYLLDGKYKVEPIVHCKDCKWYVQSDGKWQYWVCKIFEKIMRKNDYCIYGERADEDKNE